ncbi:MAG TPA: PEGA domain-containing protein, partial [candidate division Zixibacteria bacterium]|nr:PEGA domain-containing protein [candidate division Zixibacteria bacterium]
ILALVLSSAVRGQTGGQPGLTVTSDPPGALVTLTGAARLTGVAPVFFSQGIPGLYQLEVSRHGYETYRSQVTISLDRATQVNVKLTPRSRGKAALRSLILPGWGQFYTKQKAKGWILTSLAITASGVLIAAEVNYQDKRDEFDEVDAAFRRAQVGGTSADIEELRPRLFAAQADAYDAETLRWTAAGAVAAVWAVSFLDALLFFPDARGDINSQRLSIEPSFDPLSARSGMALSWRF